MKGNVSNVGLCLLVIIQYYAVLVTRLFTDKASYRAPAPLPHGIVSLATFKDRMLCGWQGERFPGTSVYWCTEYNSDTYDYFIYSYVNKVLTYFRFINVPKGGFTSKHECI